MLTVCERPLHLEQLVLLVGQIHSAHGHPLVVAAVVDAFCDSGGGRKSRTEGQQDHANRGNVDEHVFDVVQLCQEERRV